MAVDRGNVLTLLGLVGFVAALGLWFIIDGGLPWWIAMGPAALIAVLVAVGIYGAWRGWKGGRHVSPSGLGGGGSVWTDDGGISDSGDDDDD